MHPSGSSHPRGAEFLCFISGYSSLGRKEAAWSLEPRGPGKGRGEGRDLGPPAVELGPRPRLWPEVSCRVQSAGVWPRGSGGRTVTPGPTPPPLWASRGFLGPPAGSRPNPCLHFLSLFQGFCGLSAFPLRVVSDPLSSREVFSHSDLRMFVVLPSGLAAGTLGDVCVFGVLPRMCVCAPREVCVGGGCSP